MTYEETALYAQPTDPAAFDLHYERVHAPLARELPGLLTYSAFHPECSSVLRSWAGRGGFVAQVTGRGRAAGRAIAAVSRCRQGQVVSAST